MPRDPSQNAQAWLWDAIEAHDSALCLYLREAHRTQQQIYNLWRKKERARKDLKSAEVQVRMNGGSERVGRYSLTHYRNRLAEYDRKLQAAIDAAEEPRGEL